MKSYKLEMSSYHNYIDNLWDAFDAIRSDLVESIEFSKSTASLLATHRNELGLYIMDLNSKTILGISYSINNDVGDLVIKEGK